MEPQSRRNPASTHAVWRMTSSEKIRCNVCSQRPCCAYQTPSSVPIVHEYAGFNERRNYSSRCILAKESGYSCLGNDPLADCVENDFCGTVEVELLHDSRAMCLHCVGTEVEHGGDLFVRSPFCQQLKYFLLAIREQIVRILEAALFQLPHIILEKGVGDGRTEKWFAVSDGINRPVEVSIRAFFEQVALGSGSERSGQVSFIRVHAQDDDSDLRILLDELRRGLDAV